MAVHENIVSMLQLLSLMENKRQVRFRNREIKSSRKRSMRRVISNKREMLHRRRIRAQVFVKTAIMFFCHFVDKFLRNSRLFWGALFWDIIAARNWELYTRECIHYENVHAHGHTSVAGTSLVPYNSTVQRITQYQRYMWPDRITRDVRYAERLYRGKVCDKIAGVLGVRILAPIVADVCFQCSCKRGIRDNKLSLPHSRTRG